MKLKIKILLSILVLIVSIYIVWLNTGSNIEKFLKKRFVITPFEGIDSFYGIKDATNYTDFHLINIRDIKVYSVGISCFGVHPPCKFFTVIEKDGNYYLHPHDWNKFIIKYNITLRNKEDVMKLLKVYLNSLIISNACDISGLDVVCTAIKKNLINEFLNGNVYVIKFKNRSSVVALREELDKINLSDVKRIYPPPIPYDIVRDLYNDWLRVKDMIKPPIILFKDDIIVAEFYTWRGIGGVVKEWRIELTRRGEMVSIEDKEITRDIGFVVYLA